MTDVDKTSAQKNPDKLYRETWLQKDRLDLRDLFPLLRGKDPTMSARKPLQDQHPHFTQIKAAIDSGELPGSRTQHGRAFLQTTILFCDALTFSMTVENDPGWKWFIDFLHEWRAERGDIPGAENPDSTPPYRGSNAKNTKTLARPSVSDHQAHTEEFYGNLIKTGETVNRKEARAAFSERFPNAPVQIADELHASAPSKAKSRKGRPKKPARS